MLCVHFHRIITRKQEVIINCGREVCSDFYKTPRSQRQPETPRDSGRLTKDTRQVTKYNSRYSRRIMAAGGRRQMSAAGEGSNGQLTAQWNCGQNCPLVYGGKNGEVCRNLRMVISNCRTLLASGDTSNNTKDYHVVTRLTGLHPKSVYAIEVDITRQGWVWNRRPQSAHRRQRPARRRPPLMVHPRQAVATKEPEADENSTTLDLIGSVVAGAGSTPNPGGSCQLRLNEPSLWTNLSDMRRRDKPSCCLLHRQRPTTSG